MEGVYPGLTFPELTERPYTVVNMVTTIDGKSVSGNRDEPVADLGSDLDYATLRQIEVAAGAVLVGAGNLRSTPKMWFPEGVWRFVATQSGDLDTTVRFFTDCPEKAVVICPEATAKRVPAGVQILAVGEEELDWPTAFREIKKTYGCPHLVVEGGAELNGSILRYAEIDELFLTIAPKIKLGRDVPTYAGGEPLDRASLQEYRLISNQTVGDEVFLRYRRIGSDNE